MMSWIFDSLTIRLSFADLMAAKATCFPIPFSVFAVYFVLVIGKVVFFILAHN